MEEQNNAQNLNQTLRVKLFLSLVSAAETSVQQANKQVQVDLQDLGYETCGRSENEAEREDASSPGDKHIPLQHKHPMFSPANTLNNPTSLSPSFRV